MNDDMTPPETAHINDTEITPEIVAEHGLKPDEYEKIVAKSWYPVIAAPPIPGASGGKDVTNMFTSQQI